MSRAYFASAPPLHLAMHWRLAWGGFDVALAALLPATGLALFRRSALAEVLVQHRVDPSGV